jgi:hypothetical protein
MYPRIPLGQASLIPVARARQVIAAASMTAI